MADDYIVRLEIRRPDGHQVVIQHSVDSYELEGAVYGGALADGIAAKVYGDLLQFLDGEKAFWTHRKAL